MNKNRKIIGLFALLICTLSVATPVAAMENKNEKDAWDWKKNTKEQYEKQQEKEELEKRRLLIKKKQEEIQKKFSMQLEKFANKNELKIEQQDNVCICQDGSKQQIHNIVAEWLENVKKTHQCPGYGEPCPICREPLENAYSIAQHPEEENFVKKHIVHGACLWLWLKSSGEAKNYNIHDKKVVNNQVEGKCVLCHDTSKIKNGDVRRGRIKYFENLSLKDMLLQPHHCLDEAVFLLEILGNVSTEEKKIIDATDKKKIQKLCINVKNVIIEEDEKRSTDEKVEYIRKITENVLGVISKDTVTTDFLCNIYPYLTIKDRLEYFMQALEANECAMNKAEKDNDVTAFDCHCKDNRQLCGCLFYDPKISQEIKDEYYKKISLVGIDPKFRYKRICSLFNSMPEELRKTYWNKFSIEEQINFSIACAANAHNYAMFSGVVNYLVLLTCENLEQEEIPSYLERIYNACDHDTPKLSTSMLFSLIWKKHKAKNIKIENFKGDFVHDCLCALMLKGIKNQLENITSSSTKEDEGTRLFATLWNATYCWSFIITAYEKVDSLFSGWWKQLTKETRATLFEKTLPLIDEDKKESFKAMFGPLPEQNVVGTGNILNDNPPQN